LQDASGDGKTIFNIKTRKTDELPIVDFASKDYGNADQGFGFEAGPVCYRHMKAQSQ